MRIVEYYLSMARRNTRAKELREQGLTVIRSCIHNQRLHPMYVEDYHRPPSAAECGFGNTLYGTYFPDLYVVETRN